MIYESVTSFFSKVFCFTSYVNNAQGFPKPLTREEEQEYFKKYKEGDMKARDILISHNLRLVAHIVKKFQNSLEADDLISVGTIGLIKAVDTFDYTKGLQLSTYASRCIENEILMLIRANKRHKEVISLNTPHKGKADGEELPLEDVLIGDCDEDFIKKIEDNCLFDQVLEIINTTLSEREIEILKYRYGLDGREVLPQREVAKRLGCSRSYISRIESNAIKTISNKLEELERQ